MRLPLSLALAAVVSLTSSFGVAQEPADLVAPTGPRDPASEKAGFHVPPGFEVQLVASDPDIHKPMNIAFDDRGRLWVTETIEYPFPAKEGTKPRDAVKVLEDFGPDGKARKITTFADGLNIPIGLMPLPGGREALVHSIPSVDRFVDRDGDGKADSREVAYATFGSRDTHGMTNAFTWGFDGWLYACHGFNNSSEVRGKDNQVVAMQSGNTYRFRPDGSHAEQFTHGQVNPFGLCFDPLGNLYSADCHSKPVYMLLKGAYYPSFGKLSDGLGFGPEMVSHLHGSTAISGVVDYQADLFPKEWRGTIFIGNVVTNRINHDTVTWHGSTPRGNLTPDFLSSDDRWFRPVDLKLGPDGALYVADFYNKIIGHYEVPLTHPGRDRERGRIWRIVYTGEDGKAPIPPLPNFAEATIPQLIAALGSPNLTVRTLATNQLVARGGSHAIDRLKGLVVPGAVAPSRVHALWALERLGALDDSALKDATKAEDRTVRIHSMRIIAEKPRISEEFAGLVRDRLKDDDAFVRRAATQALGRHRSAANVRVLLDARHAAPAEDAQLVHAVRMALRDQFLSAAKWPGIGDPAYSEADFRDLADVALGDPGADSGRFVLEFVGKYPEGRDPLIEHLLHAARRVELSLVPEVVAFARQKDPADLGLQAALLKAVHQGLQDRGAGLSGPAREWAGEVTAKLLSGADPGGVGLGAELVGSMGLNERREALVEVARSAKAAEGSRIAVMNALSAIDPRGTADVLGPILVDPSAPMGVREAGAAALAKTNQDSGRAKLVEALPLVPGRLQTGIAAALAAGRPGAEALLKAVGEGKASARLLQERSVRVFLDQSGVPDVNKKVEALTAGLVPADAKIAELIDRRRASFAATPSDPARGAEVFTKNCAACHQIGGQGAKVGPQLDGIGVRGPDRLMEDVLDPNRNIDQAFRMTTLALTDGRTLSGLLLREDGDVLVLADSQGKEQRIARADVEQKKVSPISPMPADFADKIAEKDFLDLVAYLISRK